MTKRTEHFLPDQYADWMPAWVGPALPGWYECRGFRFDGFLHLRWDGAKWEYFGKPHGDPAFPSFGSNELDAWRGLNAPAFSHYRHELLDITGQTHGMLTAIRREYRTRHGQFWMFSCACGRQRVANLKWVTHGNTASCGCKQGNKHAVAVARPWANTHQGKM